MTELEPAVLPVTVTASHLQACAAELAGAGEVELGDLVALLGHVVTGQRNLAETLARLAGRVAESRDSGAFAAVPSAELLALSEVLHAAATAFDCSADALAEGPPLARTVAETAGLDTRL